MLKNKYKTTPLFNVNERPELEIKEPVKPASFRIFKIFNLLFLTLIRTHFGRADDTTKGIEWRHFFEDMGGLWVKMGQLMAMRTDLYEKEFTRELAKLHYRVHAFPMKYVRQVVEESIGSPLGAVFGNFEETPLAAASLAQVHRATLLNGGVSVAVKVQRPYAQEFLTKDLKMIKGLFNFLNRFKAFETLLLDDMFWELEIMLKEEVDFRYETTNLKQAKKRFKKYGIYVPKVYRRLCSDKVVVMEYIQGVTMSEYIAANRQDPAKLKLWLKTNKIKPKKVGGFLLRNVWRQVLEDNFFHGDLQPGNIMLLAKSKLAFIDLGTVGSTDEETLTFYRQQLMAIGKKAYSQAAEFSMLTSPNVPAENINKIRYSIVKGLRGALLKASLINVDIEQKTTVHNASDEMNKELAKYKISVNWGMLKLIRTFLTIDPSVVNLHPKIDLEDEWLKFYKEARWRLLKKSLASIASLPTFLGDFTRLMERIERKRALDFKAKLNKGIEALTYFLNIIKWGFRLVFIFFLWTYLYQHFDFLDRFHQNGNWFTEKVEQIPQTGHWPWIILLIIGFFFIRGYRNFVERLRQPEKPLYF